MHCQRTHAPRMFQSATARVRGPIPSSQFVAVADHEKHCLTPDAVRAAPSHRPRPTARSTASFRRRASSSWSRIESPDAGLDAIEHSLRDVRTADIAFGNLHHRAIHGEVVLAGGDDEIHSRQQTVLIHVVVVERCAAQRLADADRLQLVDAACARSRAEVTCESLRMRSMYSVAGQDFDEASVVIIERGIGGAAGLVGETPLFAVGQRHAHPREAILSRASGPTRCAPSG